MTAAPTLPADLDHDDHTHWEGTDGRTNFRPLHLSMEELQQGQKRLYQRLYSPGAFQGRLLGNLGRFNRSAFARSGCAGSTSPVSFVWPGTTGGRGPGLAASSGRPWRQRCGARRAVSSRSPCSWGCTSILPRSTPRPGPGAPGRGACDRHNVVITLRVMLFITLHVMTTFFLTGVICCPARVNVTTRAIP